MDQLIIAVVAAVIGGIFTLLTVYIQKRKKVITYEIESMTLLRFKPLNNMITISVDESVLSNDPSKKGTFAQINNAYGFQISLSNTGNEDIEKPTIEIQLDKTAKIISYETQPSSRPGYDIDIQKDPFQPNVLRILVPFINKKDKVLIRLISTGNSNKDCSVSVLGLGIKYKKASSIRNFLLLLFFTILVVIFTAITLYLPDSIWLSIGGTYSTPVKKVSPPLWFLYVFSIPVLVIVFIAALEYIKELRSSQSKGDFEWDDLKH